MSLAVRPRVLPKYSPQGTKEEGARMWDALMEVHSRTGDGPRARAAVADMRAVGMRASYVAHSCVVSAHCKSGDYGVRVLPSPESQFCKASLCKQHNELCMLASD